MRMSPQSGQIWGFLPSSSITFNIYKPLKRINQEGTGRAVLPITRARPSGFADCRFNGPVWCRGVSITLLWDKTLVGDHSLLSSPEKDRGPGAELGQHFSQTVWCYFAPLLRLQPPHLFQELRRSVSQACTDNCGLDSYMCCMPVLSLVHGFLKTVTRPNCIHAFSVEAATGGLNPFEEF